MAPFVNLQSEGNAATVFNPTVRAKGRQNIGKASTMTKARAKGFFVRKLLATFRWLCLVEGRGSPIDFTNPQPASG